MDASNCRNRTGCPVGNRKNWWTYIKKERDRVYTSRERQLLNQNCHLYAHAYKRTHVYIYTYTYIRIWFFGVVAVFISRAIDLSNFFPGTRESRVYRGSKTHDYRTITYAPTFERHPTRTSIERRWREREKDNKEKEDTLTRITRRVADTSESPIIYENQPPLLQLLLI